MRAFFYAILVGIPGGLLILMSMLMLNALVSTVLPAGQWIMLGILCFTSLVVGILSRLLRPFHAFGTALASGVVAALVILSLWVTSPDARRDDFVFGSLGMLAAAGFPLLGAWLYPRLRKRPGKNAGKLA